MTSQKALRQVVEILRTRTPDALERALVVGELYLGQEGEAPFPEMIRRQLDENFKNSLEQLRHTIGAYSERQSHLLDAIACDVRALNGLVLSLQSEQEPT